MEVLLSRPILKPLGIGLTLSLIQQFSGIDSVIFFTVDIFRASGIEKVEIFFGSNMFIVLYWVGSSIDGNLAAVIVGSVQLLSNIAALFVVDRLGRKPLSIGSGCIMSLSTASMGMAFYLHTTGNTSFGYMRLLNEMNHKKTTYFFFLTASYHCLV